MEERLDRIEESVGFTQRDVERINDQIGDLWKRLDELAARLARLERLREQDAAPEPEPDDPTELE